jgi:MFS transporter, DHA2 family, multidrug resistance protein
MSQAASASGRSALPSASAARAPAAPAKTDGQIRDEWKPKTNPWIIAVVVTLAAFMEILDTTIVNVSLPHIAGSLSASYDEATWALTSYLVANGIVLTISGWFGSIFGRKRYFLICIAMFTVCSFMCGASTSLPQLIIFRLMQGFFGGGLQPNQQSIILDSFPPAKRGAAFGVVAIATIVAPVLGPTLGGYITDQYSWQWVFYLNVPVGIVATVLIFFLVEDPPWAKARKVNADFIGLGLITLGLGCLEITMDRGEDDDWFGSGFIRITAVLAVVGIVGAIIWLRIAKKPIVNLDVFKDRNFAVGSTLIAAVGLTLYAGAVLIPQYAQEVVGYTATWAGLVLSPGGMAIILLIPFIGRLMNVVQVRYVIATGFFVMGCAFFYSSILTPTLGFWNLVGIRTFQTVSLGFLFVPISTITYTTLPRHLNSDGSALYTMLRNVFGSIGISGATALVVTRTQVHQSYLAERATPFHQPFNDLVASYQSAFRALGHGAAEAHDLAMGGIYRVFQTQASILAYEDVFIVVSVIAFAVVPICFLLSPTKGRGGGARGGH